jgi:SOS response regulatory protein OraA/RecX
MEALSMDNILSETDIDMLFSGDDNNDVQGSSPESEENNDSKKETTEELNVEGLFEGTSESVGSKEHQGVEDTTSEKNDGSSPTTNFYSSIAKALKEDGVLPDLDDDTASKIENAEDFAEIIEQQIQSKFDERQKRMDSALNAGVDKDTIRQYENTLSYLDNITDEALDAEDENGENLRKQVIYQDLINKGYSKEEAIEELNDIFDNGSDKRKAKRALVANKEFFKKA